MKRVMGLFGFHPDRFNKSSFDPNELFPFETAIHPLKEISIFVSMLSFAFLEISSLIYQCCFFNICIHVGSLYAQIENDIQKMENGNFSKTINNSLIEVRELIVDTNKYFRGVMCLSFIIDVAYIGIALTMFGKLDDALTFVFYAPMVIYDLWIFCYGSSLMVEKGDTITDVIYNIPWYNFNKKDKTLTQMMIQRSQIPIKVNIFHWRIDRELFLQKVKNGLENIKSILTKYAFSTLSTGYDCIMKYLN
ncbi:CLUMA_CG001587, isoform A [Clunio marinus]|uniref:CLUMA_CG001587, isoform A n=1 Tax=Clunio marinus TaxID=568069 RepID=A0A1J1HIA7_9DIPT|nr:CLUMA_CG001587, isoform A [Clunio marinus]